MEFENTPPFFWATIIAAIISAVSVIVAKLINESWTLTTRVLAVRVVRSLPTTFALAFLFAIVAYLVGVRVSGIVGPLYQGRATVVVRYTSAQDQPDTVFSPEYLDDWASRLATAGQLNAEQLLSDALSGGSYTEVGGLVVEHDNAAITFSVIADNPQSALDIASAVAALFIDDNSTAHPPYVELRYTSTVVVADYLGAPAVAAGLGVAQFSLVLLLLITVIRVSVDDTLRMDDDISYLTAGLPVIGYIPDFEKLKGGVAATVADKPRSPAAESIRSLRTNVEFAGVDQPLRILLVTSAGEEDGKSTIALNLALSQAQSGKRVALVDADLRKPSLHEGLGIRNIEGLTDLFRKPVHVSEVLRTWKSDRVLVITSGDLPPNPTELLGSRRMDQILAELLEMVDTVIIDGAPFFISDAWVLAAKVDGVVWIARPGHTKKGALRDLLNQARRTGANVFGVVLNRINGSGGVRVVRYSYLSHYYGEPPRQLEAPVVTQPGPLTALRPRLRGTQSQDGGAAEQAANGNVAGGQKPPAVTSALVPEPPALERGRVSLDLLYALSHELASQMDLNELMQRILKMTLESVGAGSGSMIAIDQRGEPIEGVMIYDGRTYNQSADQLEDIVSRGLAGWVIENRRPVVLSNTAEDPRWLNRPWGETNMNPRSAISVPLLAEDRVVGVLTLVHPGESFFTQDDLSLLTAIAVGISFVPGSGGDR